MITIKNNYVHISFPEITEALYQQAEQYIEKHLPKILADNHARHQQGETSFSDAEIEAAFRDEIQETMGRLCRTDLFSIVFERKLRVPNDGMTYKQPRQLGLVPLRQPQEFAATAPPSWLDQNEPVTVMLPLHQSEAMRIFFHGFYPCAIKVGSGNVNAITGTDWMQKLLHDPADFVSTPKHKWIDGLTAPDGSVRPIAASEAEATSLATSLAAAHPTDSPADNRLLLQVIPLRASVYFRRKIRPVLPTHINQLIPEILRATGSRWPRIEGRLESPTQTPDRCNLVRITRFRVIHAPSHNYCKRGSLREENEDGSPREDVYFDNHKPIHWDKKLSECCVVQICPTQQWQAITGSKPPQEPIAREVFIQHDIPWLDRYDVELQSLRDTDTPTSGTKTRSAKKASSTRARNTTRAKKPKPTAKKSAPPTQE